MKKYCPRCIEDWENNEGIKQEGIKNISYCLDCGVCEDCEHLMECSWGKNKNGQVVHHLWWIRKYLNTQWGDKEYKDICREELSTDVCKEVDELVKHIKENY